MEHDIQKYLPTVMFRGKLCICAKKSKSELLSLEQKANLKLITYETKSFRIKNSVK